MLYRLWATRGGENTWGQISLSLCCLPKPACLSTAVCPLLSGNPPGESYQGEEPFPDGQSCLCRLNFMFVEPHKTQLLFSELILRVQIGTSHGQASACYERRAGGDHPLLKSFRDSKDPPGLMKLSGKMQSHLLSCGVLIFLFLLFPSSFLPSCPFSFPSSLHLGLIIEYLVYAETCARSQQHWNKENQSVSLSSGRFIQNPHICYKGKYWAPPVFVSM